MNRGCSIIFINRHHEVLLFLRDAIKQIPYPNMWDIPGGHIEPGESPKECIIREMKEEIEYNLQDFSLFSVTEFDNRREYTFWKKEEFDLKKTPLNEGQCLKWFTYAEICSIKLACCFNKVLDDFFRKSPFIHG